MIAKVKERKLNYGMVTVEQCVDATLRDLGHETTTFGPIMHDVIGTTMTTIMRHFTALPGDKK